MAPTAISEAIAPFRTDGNFQSLEYGADFIEVRLTENKMRRFTLAEFTSWNGWDRSADEIRARMVPTQIAQF